VGELQNNFRFSFSINKLFFPPTPTNQPTTQSYINHEIIKATRQHPIPPTAQDLVEIYSHYDRSTIQKQQQQQQKKTTLQ